MPIPVNQETDADASEGSNESATVEDKRISNNEGSAQEEGKKEEVELSSEEKLAQELGQWKEDALRTRAELDNYRKRVAREKTESLRFYNQGLLEELLPVLDNFSLGLQACEQEEGSIIYQGMQMVKRQLDDFLTAQGVKRIDALGQPFDPNTHDAVSQEASEEIPEGSIIRVTREGYHIHDRLLRPASVVVCRNAQEEDAGEE